MSSAIIVASRYAIPSLDQYEPGFRYTQGSNRPCARIQRRRARATSARCRSVACRSPGGIFWPYGIELLMHIGKRRRHEHIDAPEQVVLRDTVVQPKLIEQARLIAAPSTHHRPPPTSSRRKSGITVRR